MLCRPAPNLCVTIRNFFNRCTARQVEYADEEGFLYFFRYPVEGGGGDFLPVATTRPETILGDTAVAVNPNVRLTLLIELQGRIQSLVALVHSPRRLAFSVDLVAQHHRKALAYLYP
jgi:hypothetical protein